MKQAKQSPDDGATSGSVDSLLRDRVNRDIAAFLVAFDAMLESATPQNRHALIEAIEQLMRAGARTTVDVAC
jgi:hypothetical protein